MLLAVIMVALAAGTVTSGRAAVQDAVVVQSRTSTQNSGFYRHVVPTFKGETGIAVRVIAFGTGQALKNTRNCDGDLLSNHAREAELDFVARGFGRLRSELMYNAFVIIGPPADPAGIATANDTPRALQRITASGAPFASRGDASDTHMKERGLLKAARDCRPRLDRTAVIAKPGMAWGPR